MKHKTNISVVARPNGFRSARMSARAGSRSRSTLIRCTSTCILRTRAWTRRTPTVDARTALGPHFGSSDARGGEGMSSTARWARCSAPRRCSTASQQPAAAELLGDDRVTGGPRGQAVCWHSDVAGGEAAVRAVPRELQEREVDSQDAVGNCVRTHGQLHGHALRGCSGWPRQPARGRGEGRGGHGTGGSGLPLLIAGIHLRPFGPCSTS